MVQLVKEMVKTEPDYFKLVLHREQKCDEGFVVQLTNVSNKLEKNERNTVINIGKKCHKQGQVF